MNDITITQTFIYIIEGMAATVAISAAILLLVELII